MFGTLTELHRWRSRVGIAVSIAGVVVLSIGVYFFFEWWGLQDDMFLATANDEDVGQYVKDARDYGVVATVAFVLGIPVLLLGLGQVWLASRRNALIEGAMIEKLACLDREKAVQSPPQ